MWIAVYCAVVVLILHQTSSLKCYQCESHADFWIDDKTLPSFPSNCSVIEAEYQCTASIRWFTLKDGKESCINYDHDLDLRFLPKNSSFSFVFAGMERELETASTRGLIYSCTTDNCNNGESLKQALSSLTLKENFAPLDVLFSNGTANFTDQSSCVDFSNSTHLDCPMQASPLSSCPICLLLEMESPSSPELCARCPKEPVRPVDLEFVQRRVFFFLSTRTRMADTVTLSCRTKGCNALNNVKRIHRLSRLEFDFKKFFSSSP